MLFDEEKSDYDDIATSGESKEIERAEKKAAKKAAKESKKRAKLLKEAEKLGWTGGSLEPYAPGTCIGGNYFGNYEGKLPDGN